MFIKLNKCFICILVFTVFSVGCKTSADNSKKKNNNLSEKQYSPKKLLPPNYSKIIAIGDLHGDYQVAVQTLQYAGAINKAGKWIGKKLIVVQTGDILDKGDEEKKIIDLFSRLKQEAAQSKGAVYTLLGNHEILNYRSEFDYVTNKGFKSFQAFDKSKLSFSLSKKFDPEKRGRAVAFAPGGPLSKFFSNNKVILKLGKIIFVHGGLTSEHLDFGIKKINRQTSAFIKNKGKLPDIMKGSKAPTWLRTFSKNLDKQKCLRLNKILEKAKVEMMVVGHTIQKKGITSGCKGKIWRIDTGMSRYYGNNILKILQISNKGIKILSTKRKQ